MKKTIIASAPKFTLTKRQQKMVNGLDHWTGVAFDHEVAFLERFGKGDPWMLTEIAWDGTNMRMVYILNCGQHVSDSVKTEEWLKFYNDKVKESPETR